MIRRMAFLRALLRTALWRPRLAAAALWWHLTGRKTRARNRLRVAQQQGPGAYARWLREVEILLPPPNPPARHDGESPLLSVLMHWHGEAQGMRSLVALQAQNFADWELVLITRDGSAPARPLGVSRCICIAAGQNALASAMRTARGSFVLPLPDSAVLPPHALARYAEAISTNPDANIFYADQDEITAKGQRKRPWMKPRWNPEMFLAQDYLSSAVVIRTQAALATMESALATNGTAEEAVPYTLLLHLTEAGYGGLDAMQPIHIPHVLAHLPPASGASQDERVAAVARHLAPLMADAGAGAFGSVAVNWRLPAELPLVSILIPMRDRVELIRTCLAGVLSATTYPHIEVIVVDNGSTDPATLDYLTQIVTDQRVRVLRDDGPFNFSALNNHAAMLARGSYLCLLNNDVEIIDAGWLTALMRQAARPGVGAVGAKLLYADHTIQHAGVVIGMGNAAGHAHRFQRDHDAGYFAQAHITHEASAVTAACMVIEKRKYDAVGGLDEDAFAVAFNDVDLCLKLRAAGWRNIYEPAARLIHHESKSRARDTRPDQIERWRRELISLQQRWGAAQHNDPLFHPALDHTSETYMLRL